MKHRTFPSEIAEWERRTGFEASNARIAFSEQRPTKEGFDRDIKLFVLWYTDMLLFGQKISSELKQ